jgi:hypothetical protein
VKTCRKCLASKPFSDFGKRSDQRDGLNYYCISCHRQNGRNSRNRHKKKRDAINREYYSQNKERWRDYSKKFSKKNPEIKFAHKIITELKRLGLIEQQPCYVCDAPKAQAHHEDYSLPHDILWLCNSCHKQRHREINDEKRRRNI